MADAKHTSGPWMAVEIGQGGPWDNPIPVCEILTADGGSRICEYVTEANARLIAASPEMLAEMRRLLPVLERLENSPLWHDLTAGLGIATLNGYRAALAKASA